MTFSTPRSTSRSAFSGVRTPPPTRMRARAAIHSTMSSFEPVPIAASRSMTWITGKAANLSSISCGDSAFERLLAPLHELNDLAVHQIDAGNDHECTLLTGTPSPSRYCFRSSTVYVP